MPGDRVIPGVCAAAPIYKAAKVKSAAALAQKLALPESYMGVFSQTSDISDDPRFLEILAKVHSVFHSRPERMLDGLAYSAAGAAGDAILDSKRIRVPKEDIERIMRAFSPKEAYQRMLNLVGREVLESHGIREEMFKSDGSGRELKLTPDIAYSLVTLLEYENANPAYLIGMRGNHPPYTVPVRSKEQPPFPGYGNIRMEECTSSGLIRRICEIIHCTPGRPGLNELLESMSFSKEEAKALGPYDRDVPVTPPDRVLLKMYFMYGANPSYLKYGDSFCRYRNESDYTNSTVEETGQPTRYSNFKSSSNGDGQMTGKICSETLRSLGELSGKVRVKELPVTQKARVISLPQKAEEPAKCAEPKKEDAAAGCMTAAEFNKAVGVCSRKEEKVDRQPMLREHKADVLSRVPGLTRDDRKTLLSYMSKKVCDGEKVYGFTRGTSNVLACLILGLNPAWIGTGSRYPKYVRISVDASKDIDVNGSMHRYAEVKKEFGIDANFLKDVIATSHARTTVAKPTIDFKVGTIAYSKKISPMVLQYLLLVHGVNPGWVLFGPRYGKYVRFTDSVGEVSCTVVSDAVVAGNLPASLFFTKNAQKYSDWLKRRDSGLEEQIQPERAAQGACVKTAQHSESSLAEYALRVTGLRKIADGTATANDRLRAAVLYGISPIRHSDGKIRFMKRVTADVTGCVMSAGSVAHAVRSLYEKLIGKADDKQMSDVAAELTKLLVPVKDDSYEELLFRAFEKFGLDFRYIHEKNAIFAIESDDDGLADS